MKRGPYKTFVRNFRTRARDAVHRAVKAGKLWPAKLLLCVECGNPASWYDHHLGYEPQHWLDVQPICLSCDGKRRIANGQVGNQYTIKQIQ